MAHILVVDDDPMVIDICTTYLRRAGYDVGGVVNTEKAHTYLQEKQVDLLVLDVQMSRESGLEFLQRIRGDWPDLPVVIITAYPGLTPLIEAVRFDVYEFLSKPFRPSKLLKIIKGVLARAGQ